MKNKKDLIKDVLWLLTWLNEDKDKEFKNAVSVLDSKVNAK